MVNPFAVRWFWRGLKGHSVTFAALFASVLLGASIAGAVHRALAAAGIHWLYALILPVLLFGWLSKMETHWLPDQARRRMIARSLLFGSVLVAVLVTWLKPGAPPEPDRPPPAEGPKR
jgi:peptidoglycan/LPS O-acetylase OafA/YrhL